MSLEPAVSSMSKNSSYFLSAYNVPGAVLSILYSAGVKAAYKKGYCYIYIYLI